MGYIVCAVMFFFLGRKYQELIDLMQARRVAKMVMQADLIAKEREQHEKAAAIDLKMHDRLYGEKEAKA